MVAKICLRCLVTVLGSILMIGCLCGTCEEATKNKEIVLASMEAMNRGELDALDGYYAADFVRHCPATPDVEVTNLEAYKAMVTGWMEAFPDAEMTVNHLIAEDSMVAFWGAFSGTHDGPMGPYAATGKRLESQFAGMHRFADGMIVETWVTWDSLSDLTQLGLYPPEPVEAVE